MKRTILLTAGLALALLTGCIVTSVYPFYFEKDVVFEPALLGDWSKAPPANEHWKFERDGETAYRLTYTEDDKSSFMQAHLFKLHGQTFLDLFAPEAKCDVVPPAISSHTLLLVLQTGPALRMAPLNYEWLGTLLEKKPKAIRHHVVQTSGDKQLVLTADTAELQRFVVKHLKTEVAWKDTMELQPATAKPQSR